MNTNKQKTLIIKSFESVLVIGYILFEELIWNVFAKPVYNFFKHLVAFDSLKQVFVAMNRYLLLSVFLTILVTAEALGFISGFYFVKGQVFLGIIVYALKIPIAAFTFWLFELTKDQLMTFQWLKTGYQYVMNLIEKFMNSSVHIYIKEKITSIRSNIKFFMQRHFGKEEIIANIKSHYLFFKPFLASFFKLKKTS